MNSDRIKQIQLKTAYPNSVSVHQALLQVWNECSQQYKELRDSQEWISVDSTRRPEEGQKVLAVYAGVYEPIVVEYWTDTSNSHFGHQPATHWKPLPTPPEV